MRILNVGVLVCVGGILAALPFRHSKEATEELRYPARATGPMVSLADKDGRFSPATDDLAVRQVAVEPAHQAVPLEDLIAFDAPAAPPSAAPRRPLDLPGSYEDLAVPVIPSHLMQDRFSATSQAAKAENAGRWPEQSPPVWQMPRERFDSAVSELALADDLQPADSPRIDDSPHEATSRGETNFISAPLPKADPPSDSHPSRQRHWIRQP